MHSNSFILPSDEAPSVSVVKLAGGGSATNGATPSSLTKCHENVITRCPQLLTSTFNCVILKIAGPDISFLNSIIPTKTSCLFE